MAKQYTTPSGAVVSEDGQLVSGPPTPAAATPTTPAPVAATPAAPAAPAVGTTPPAPSTTINVGTPAAPTTPTAQPKQPLAYDPTVNPSVVDLLNSTGADSSPEARKQLAAQYGIQSYTGTAAQNVDLAKKYTAAYNKLKGTPMPETGAAADSALDTHFKDEAETIDNAEQKFFDSIGGMNPVVKNLYDQINQQLSSTNTRKTYEEEFAQAFADENIAAGIPGDSLSETQMKMLNLKNIMEGTEDDIRNEISNVGGFATESQVAALTGARNKTLMKQASFLQQSMALKQDYVDQLMQFSEKDRAQVEKDVDKKLGLTEKLVSLQENMQNAAKENYQKIIDKVGFTGLAEAFGDDPKAMNLAEKALGLPAGTLQNEKFLAMSKKDESKPLQFVGATDNQASGFFDPNTGKFTSYGGGGSGTGSGGTGSVGSGTKNGTDKAISDALSVILGSGTFTKLQQQNVINAINKGQNPFTVIKNQAKNIMGQTLATDLTNNETARKAMLDLSNDLARFYAKGGSTNIFAGTYEQAQAKLGQVDKPELRELAAQIESSLQAYRRATTGTAYSVQEGKSIASVFPGINKTQGLNTAIINGRVRAFDSSIDGMYESVLGAETYQKLKQSQTPVKSSTGGQIAVQDQKTKQVKYFPAGTDLSGMDTKLYRVIGTTK